MSSQSIPSRNEKTINRSNRHSCPKRFLFVRSDEANDWMNECLCQPTIRLQGWTDLIRLGLTSIAHAFCSLWRRDLPIMMNYSRRRRNNDRYRPWSAQIITMPMCRHSYLVARSNRSDLFSFWHIRQKHKWQTFISLTMPWNKAPRTAHSFSAVSMIFIVFAGRFFFCPSECYCSNWSIWSSCVIMGVRSIRRRSIS